MKSFARLVPQVCLSGVYLGVRECASNQEVQPTSCRVQETPRQIWSLDQNKNEGTHHPPQLPSSLPGLKGFLSLLVGSRLRSQSPSMPWGRDARCNMLEWLPRLQETVVLRESKKLTTAVEKLVVGDIVEVKSGDRLPADIRIIKSAGFKVLAMLASRENW